MVYISSDGKVHQNRPWSLGRVLEIFYGFLAAIVLFFQTLVGYNASTRSFGGGSGSRGGGGRPGGGGGGPGGNGPKGPRIGRITTIQDCTIPGGG